MKWSEFKALTPQAALEMVKLKRPDIHKQLIESLKDKKTVTKQEAKDNLLASVKRG